MERDWIIPAVNTDIINFNSHAHVERDVFGKKAYKPRKYFNSHAHVERDFLAKRHINHANISTHTLTWSVTVLISFQATANLFQLTRSRGAWLYNAWLLSIINYFNSHAHVERDWNVGNNTLTNQHFNSHAHVERDAQNISILYIVYSISTHTLTWSVTKPRK